MTAILQEARAACDRRDWPRARELFRTARAAAELQPDDLYALFNGICRVHRSRVHQITGAWDEAEQEAGRVWSELGRLHVAAAAKAHYLYINFSGLDDEADGLRGRRVRPSRDRLDAVRSACDPTGLRGGRAAAVTLR